MRKKFIIVLLLILFGAVFQNPVLSEELEDLNIMTEYYPPFNYEDDGDIKGIAVELLFAAAKEMGSSLRPSDIQMEQWSVAYQKTIKEPGSMLFSTTRKDSREKLFKWAGPIASDNSCLMVKKENNLKIISIKDIMKNNLKIGVVKDDVAHSTLQEAGVPDNYFVVRAFPGLCLIDLFRDNIDAWAYGELAVMWMLGLYGFDSSQYGSALTFSEGSLYFAFNSKINDDVVSKLQKAVDQVKLNGEYDRIINNYR